MSFRVQDPKIIGSAASVSVTEGVVTLATMDVTIAPVAGDDLLDIQSPHGFELAAC